MAKIPVKPSKPEPQEMPLFKTVEQMSIISGIGENKLRTLIEKGEIDYIQNGNRRLLTEVAIWDWYERTKIPARERQHATSLHFRRDVVER
jgi:hypothetical protein